MQGISPSPVHHDSNPQNCVVVEGIQLESQPDNAAVISSQNTELVLKQPIAPAIGSVSVVNSEDVHFGNKTYLNGPITIKNLITSSNVDGLQKNYKEVLTKKLFCINYQKTIVFILVFLIALLLVLYVTIVKTVEYYQEHGDGDTHTGEDPPYIAPHILRFVSRDDWLAQPVEGPLDKLTQPAPWVIITHTGTPGCKTQSQCILRVRIIQTFHIESKGWFDIGYNFLVGGDGSVYEGRGWEYVGAHTQGYNNISIGIAFIGTFNKIVPTDNQLNACQKLIDHGVKLGKLSKDYKLLGHRQLMTTLSPGDELFEIIEKWPHFVQNVSDLQQYFERV